MINGSTTRPRQESRQAFIGAGSSAVNRNRLTRDWFLFGHKELISNAIMYFIVRYLVGKLAPGI